MPETSLLVTEARRLVERAQTIADDERLPQGQEKLADCLVRLAMVVERDLLARQLCEPWKSAKGHANILGNLRHCGGN